MTDNEYVALVLETLEAVISSWHPDFVIYDAGSDVHGMMRWVDYLSLRWPVSETIV